MIRLSVSGFNHLPTRRFLWECAVYKLPTPLAWHGEQSTSVPRAWKRGLECMADPNKPPTQQDLRLISTGGGDTCHSWMTSGKSSRQQWMDIVSTMLRVSLLE